MSGIDVERLARAMVVVSPNPYDYPLEHQDPAYQRDDADWMTSFEWHRDEEDLGKARAAAQVFARRYAADRMGEALG